MPPPEFGKPLEKNEVDMIRQWISWWRARAQALVVRTAIAQS